MGIKAGSIYGLGVQLGHASYFASVHNKDVARMALEGALSHATKLTQNGIKLNLTELKHASANPKQAVLEALRGDYRDTIAGTAYLHVYDFGVCVGLAEGQSTSSSAAAKALAIEGMTAAAKREAKLLAYGLVPITSEHGVIEMLRIQWQRRFLSSAVG
jgi:hypothetical protein